MTMFTRAGLAGAMTAGLLLAAGPGQAQQSQEGQPARQGPSEEEISRFLDDAAKGMVEAVRQGEFERVLKWTRTHLADEATFTVTNEVYVGDDRKAVAAVTLDKEDMIRVGRMAMGVMSGMQGRAIEDYSLDIEVQDVVPAGPDAATVATQITESGTFAPPGGDSGGQGQATQGQAAQPIELRLTATCKHLIRRDGESFMIGLSTCEARTEL